MDLIFGLACDGRAYPDFPGLGAGVVHAAVVGPTGLIDVLEVQLGLTGPRGAEAVRIAAYAAKLRAALRVSVNPFYAPSFARDPWATAKALLAWRDQLTAAGWTGGVIGSPRIDDLARAEAQTPPLPPGAPDRLRAVLADWRANRAQDHRRGHARGRTLKPISPSVSRIIPQPKPRSPNARPAGGNGPRVVSTAAARACPQMQPAASPRGLANGPSKPTLVSPTPCC